MDLLPLIMYIYINLINDVPPIISNKKIKSIRL
jgi:hypothetical protein